MLKLNTASIMSVVFLSGILIMVNVIGIRLFVRADLTSSKMYSLSKASKDTVANVEDKILVKAYFSPNLPGNYPAYERYLRDMLEDYRAYSRGHLDYEFINPGDEKALEEEAQSFQIVPRTFQAVANDKVEMVKGYTGVVFIYGDKKESIPTIDRIDNLEYEITSLIRRITIDRLPILSVASTGTEQEKASMQQLYESLERNYNVQPADINESLIATGSDAILILAPRQPFTDWMLYNIDQYIISGGKVGFFMNWFRADIQQSQQAMPYGLNINGFLNSYGIGLGEDMISDIECTRVGMQSRQGRFNMTQQVPFYYFPVIKSFNSDHIITRDLQMLRTYYPSSVDTTLAAAKGYKSQALMYTSGYSIRESGPMMYLDPMRQRTARDFSDKNVPVAAIVKGTFTSYFAESGPPEKPSTDTESEDNAGDITIEADPTADFKANAVEENRLLVVGDGHVGLDGYLDPQHGLMFIQNSIDWLIQSEDLIAIRSKQIPQKPLRDLSPLKKKLIRWANLFGPSILIIFMGIVLWQVRRIKKRALIIQ